MLNLQYFGHLKHRANSLEKTLIWGIIKDRRWRDDRGWDGWMVSPTQWTWIWSSSRKWWRTRKPGVLFPWWSQTCLSDWTTPTTKPFHLELWPHETRDSWIKILAVIWQSSLVAQMVKNPPAMQETWVQSLDQEDPLEKEMATHSSIHAWKIPWTEQPGGLQSMRSQSVEHDWVTNTFTSLSDLSLTLHNWQPH